MSSSHNILSWRDSDVLTDRAVSSPEMDYPNSVVVNSSDIQEALGTAMLKIRTDLKRQMDANALERGESKKNLGVYQMIRDQAIEDSEVLECIRMRTNGEWKVEGPENDISALTFLRLEARNVLNSLRKAFGEDPARWPLDLRTYRPNRTQGAETVKFMFTPGSQRRPSRTRTLARPETNTRRKRAKATTQLQPPQQQQQAASTSRATDAEFFRLSHHVNGFLAETVGDEHRMGLISNAVTQGLRHDELYRLYELCAEVVRRVDMATMPLPGLEPVFPGNDGNGDDMGELDDDLMRMIEENGGEDITDSGSSSSSQSFTSYESSNRSQNQDSAESMSEMSDSNGLFEDGEEAVRRGFIIPATTHMPLPSRQARDQQEMASQPPASQREMAPQPTARQQEMAPQPPVVSQIRTSFVQEQQQHHHHHHHQQQQQRGNSSQGSQRSVRAVGLGQCLQTIQQHGPSFEPIQPTMPDILDRSRQQDQNQIQNQRSRGASRLETTFVDMDLNFWIAEPQQQRLQEQRYQRHGDSGWNDQVQMQHRFQGGIVEPGLGMQNLQTSVPAQEIRLELPPDIGDNGGAAIILETMDGDDNNDRGQTIRDTQEAEVQGKATPPSSLQPMQDTQVVETSMVQVQQWCQDWKDTLQDLRNGSSNRAKSVLKALTVTRKLSDSVIDNGSLTKATNAWSLKSGDNTLNEQEIGSDQAIQQVPGIVEHVNPKLKPWAQRIRQIVNALEVVDVQEYNLEGLEKEMYNIQRFVGDFYNVCFDGDQQHQSVETTMVSYVLMMFTMVQSAFCGLVGKQCEKLAGTFGTQQEVWNKRFTLYPELEDSQMKLMSKQLWCVWEFNCPIALVKLIVDAQSTDDAFEISPTDSVWCLFPPGTWEQIVRMQNDWKAASELVMNFMRAFMERQRLCGKTLLCGPESRPITLHQRKEKPLLRATWFSCKNLEDGESHSLDGSCITVITPKQGVLKLSRSSFLQLIWGASKKQN